MKLFGLGLIAITTFAAVFAQLPVAPQPTSLPGAESKVYKTIGETMLMLHIFQPADRKAGETRPAIVFFFGGGWRQGTVTQFVEHSKHLSSRGMVAIVADYRVKSRHGVTPVECIADAKSAIRWVRSHAKEFGIDPYWIAAGGGSAGGHLAAATATVREFDEKGEDLKGQFRAECAGALQSRARREQDSRRVRIWRQGGSRFAGEPHSQRPSAGDHLSRDSRHNGPHQSSPAVLRRDDQAHQPVRVGAVRGTATWFFQLRAW